MSVHASVGIALGRPGATTVDELLRNADVAMYSAKHGGKRRFTAYEPKMHTRIRHRQELVTALERAVERDEIDVHYQPIVDLETGAMVAVEALARWDRPLHGLIGPDAFIPLADEIGLMVGIGRSVLRQACNQARSWQTAFSGHEGLRVNVNLSPSELSDPALVGDVEAILRNSGLSPDRLVLEITESGVMRNPAEALATMATLRELGVSLALDDFGTGHSSLAHLREFPIDSLKIAREFVSGLPARSRRQRLRRRDRAARVVARPRGRRRGRRIGATGRDRARVRLHLRAGLSLRRPARPARRLELSGIAPAPRARRSTGRLTRTARRRQAIAETLGGPDRILERRRARPAGIE